jgi:type I restriction enzyme S subunit
MFVKLGEVIDINPKEKMKRGELHKKISMKDLSEFDRDIHSYSKQMFTGGSKFRNGDVLLSRITPCLENGKTAKVSILDEEEVAFGSTEFYVLRAKPGIVLPNYLYYLVTSDYFRSAMIKSMTGTSGRQRVPIDAVSEYEFDLPSLSKQEQLSNPLRQMDDKILINKKINDNLNAI